MPIIGGQLFLLFPDHKTTYHYLFLWQSFLLMVATAIFMTVPTTSENKARQAIYSHRKPPLGARLCDYCLFGSNTPNKHLK